MTSTNSLATDVSRREILQWATASAMVPWVAGNLTTGGSAIAHAAEVGNVLKPEQKLKDSRLGPLKDYDGYFPWTPSSSTTEWQTRAEQVRRQILVACGLWPMPVKTPLQYAIHGRVDRDEYTIDRVYIETFPGLHVTGSLYRPRGASGKRPAILSPHGHWANGRFHDHGEAAVTKEIASGSEKFPIGGRHPLQARCVQLARMGCVVFLYDMLGYADNLALSYDLIHRFAKQRPELSAPDNWGLFSAQSELRLLNALGLQTWNGIRALDFLTNLPDVDPQRIGVTGASGGGTQTFMLGAIDSRPAAFFPAVMVSTAMQGGCTCENATYLRVGTGNIEFAAMIAPRPLGMSAANDWTKDLETKGLPELKQHFAMLHVGDKVEGKHFPYPHNYNAPSREMMYSFFNKHLQLGFTEPIVERDFQPLTKEEATVWSEAHRAPASNVAAEQKVLRAFDADSNLQIDGLIKNLNSDSGKQNFRKIVGGGWDVLIGRQLPVKDQIVQTKIEEIARDGHTEYHSILRDTVHKEEIPAVFLLPKAWKKTVVLWISSNGKNDLWTTAGQPTPAIRKLLDAGAAVAAIDVLHTGEFQDNGEPIKESRSVANKREFGGYTWGYNHPLFSQRVHDVLKLISFTQHHPAKPSAVHLAGFGDAGLWSAAAVRLAGNAIQKVAVSTEGFRFVSITELRDPRLLPGAVKYGDVPCLLGLCAPHSLWIAGESQPISPVTKAIYEALGSANSITASSAQGGDAVPLAAADWLLG